MYKKGETKKLSEILYLELTQEFVLRHRIRKEEKKRKKNKRHHFDCSPFTWIFSS